VGKVLLEKQIHGFLGQVEMEGKEHLGREKVERFQDAQLIQHMVVARGRSIPRLRLVGRGGMFEQIYIVQTNFLV
jgi:hypothetical protein